MGSLFRGVVETEIEEPFVADAPLVVAPFVVAPHYLYLPGLDVITPPDAFPAHPEVMVTFDCGSLGRLGSSR